MRGKKALAAAAAAGAALLLTGAKGCGVPAAQPVDCTPMPGWSIRTSGDGVIFGQTGVECASVPKSYSATVTLQWATGKRSAERVWEDRGEPYTTTVAPDAAGEEYPVSAPCQPGRWRIYLKVTGTSSTGEPGGGEEVTGHLRITNCKQHYQLRD